MIVEITVPSLGEAFDFCVDEKRTVKEALSDIVLILEEKTKSEESRPARDYLFCRAEGKEIIYPDRTFAANGIREGSSLLLV